VRVGDTLPASLTPPAVILLVAVAVLVLRTATA
jgi:hypothetical protein